ncbi:hypothetical protein E4U55_004791 [Claviceps digitariae]|nr:hypothetical protein E4U55_004791 [Claviceps digitariae]
MSASNSRQDLRNILEDAIEELTIQNVVLESMESESWPGIELERQEVADKIMRLRDKIKRIRSGTYRPTDDDTRPHTHEQPPSGPSTGAPSTSEPRTPSIAAGRSPMMATPQGSSLNVRNGKRGFGEADSDSANGHVKSRRTTPIRHDGGVRESSGHSRRSLPSQPLDIIDLTGDDVDVDAYCISQQLVQAKQREQEKEDRRMALQLSGNQSPVPSSMATPSSSRTESAQPSALFKLMETQRLNAGGRTDGPWSPSSSAFVAASGKESPSPSQTEQYRMKMPGAYSPSWDAALRAQTGKSSPFVPAPTVQNDSGRHPFGAQHSQVSTLGAQPKIGRSSVLPLNSSTCISASGFQQPVAAVSRYSRPSSIAGPSASRMSRIIEKTSMFDYTNGVDIYGNPLDDRLTSVLDDDHEPMTGREIDDLLKNITPDIDIPEHNREVGPEGLKYPLYRHQGVALAWMKKMEEGTNKGGILADDMGLGKTISTLSLMLSNPAESRPKTNLIIGPLSLIRQWEEEIVKKTKSSHRLSVFVHHGKKSTTEELLKFDVVLTTYGTIASELKRLDQFMEDNQGRNIDFNDRACAFKFPLLNPAKAVFHRVILDEAQCIKNRNTRTAKACHRLKSTYKWCLTGTPMMNGILELFSLLKFLQIKPYNSWDRFRQAFGALFGQRGDPKSQAMDRLRALLKAVMLRRKKNSKLDGKPILVLPPKTEQIVYAELSTDERDFYKQLEDKAQVMFSKYLREGSVGKNYSSILVLLLRLRQACCHPHLNLDVDDAISGVVEGGGDVEQPVKDLDKAIVERIRTMENFECPICYDVVPSPLFFIPCGHDSCKDCLIRISDTAMSQNILEGHESNKAKCPVCRGEFDPRKCFTYDLFKKIHMPESVEKPDGMDSYATDSNAESDSDEEEDSDSEDEADEVDDKGNLKGFIVDDEEDEKEEDDAVGKIEEDDELADLEALKMEASLREQKERRRKQIDKKQKKEEKKKKKKRNKGKEKKLDVKPSMLKSLRLEAAKNRDAYKKYMRYLRKTWMPAAKVSECMNILTRINHDTGDKTIVFSQWTLLLDLIEVAMWHEKVSYRTLRYDGSMTGDQRSGAAQTFRDDPNARVMLVSLRAGNAGLNLTAANRVIIMDPFWNPYIEMQAIDRTYRIGQQREVQVYRILTQMTVEDRIVQLQEKKKEIVEAALDETESMKIGRLNVNELKFLFNTF